MRNKEKNSLRGKLTANNYLKVSYPLLTRFDPSAAVFITFLVHIEIFNDENKTTDKDGFFMIRRDFVRDRVGITEKAQIRITKELVDAGLIEYTKRGIPPKSFIKLNHKEIDNILDGNKK